MSWRFALTPKWIIRHLLVVLLVAAMVWALFWQLGRLHDKRAYKHLVEGRQEQPAAPVGDLLPPGLHDGDAGVDDVLYRTATAEGTYVGDRTVVVENRTNASDSPGAWVLTPLELADGRAVLVNRGFVGYTVDGTIVPPPAPTGEVTVTGLLLPSQHRGSFGARDPKTGVLEVVARVDLDRIDAQVEGDLLPAYLQPSTSRPAEPPVPEGTPRIEALGPPGHQRGPAPVLRRAVGDLQHDRVGGLRPAPAEGGRPAGHVTHVAASVVDAETSDLLIVSSDDLHLRRRSVPRDPDRRRDARLRRPLGDRQDHRGRHRPERRDLAGHALPRLPGGKDVAFEALLRHETAHFFDVVSQPLAQVTTLEDTVVIGFVEAARFVSGHGPLQYLLEHEPERVLPSSAFAGLSRVFEIATAFTVPHLRPFVADDEAALAGADWLVRQFFSYVLVPTPALVLTDAAAVRRYVRTFVLPALSNPEGEP